MIQFKQNCGQSTLSFQPIQKQHQSGLESEKCTLTKSSITESSLSKVHTHKIKHHRIFVVKSAHTQNQASQNLRCQKCTHTKSSITESSLSKVHSHKIKHHRIFVVYVYRQTCAFQLHTITALYVDIHDIVKQSFTQLFIQISS